MQLQREMPDNHAARTEGDDDSDATTGPQRLDEANLTRFRSTDRPCGREYAS
jgi:hypothetical protein